MATPLRQLSKDGAALSGPVMVGDHRHTLSDISARFMSPGDPALLPHWHALARDAVEPNAFNAPWFLGPALRCFDTRHAVRLFTLWVTNNAGESRLVGLMPLSRETHYGAHPIPHLSNWLHYNAFLGTPLVADGYEQPFWQTLLSNADVHARGALFLHINRLTEGGPLQLALSTVADDQRRLCACVSIEERAFLQSALDPNAYYEATVRSKKRKELRRQENRLAEIGAVDFVRETGGAGLDEWTGQFLRLEAAGWKGNNRSALGSHQASRDFLTHVLRDAAAAGALERLAIHFDGRPIAMLVNFLTAPGSFSFKTAFDEAFARFSPGVLLQIENLAILNHPGIDWMDSCAAADHPMIDSLWSG